MATTPANAKQTGFNAAATLVGAEVSAGLHDSVQTAREAFFAVAKDVAGQIESVLSDADKPQARGGRPGGRGGKREFTAESARDTAIKYGIFQGLKLGDIALMTQSEAEEKYGYTNGSGMDYIEWLSTDANRNEFIRDAAKALVTAAREGSDQ